MQCGSDVGPRRFGRLEDGHGEGHCVDLFGKRNAERAAAVR
jgi:hypothetical protein